MKREAIAIIAVSTVLVVGSISIYAGTGLINGVNKTETLTSQDTASSSPLTPAVTSTPSVISTPSSIINVALMDDYMKNTLATKMIFLGEDTSWSTSFTVEEPLKKADGSPSDIETLIITPKVTWGQFVTKKVKFKLTTSQGCISGERWIKSGESIEIETSNLSPNPDETLSIDVSMGSKKHTINLVNTVKNIIAPQDAFKSALEAYFTKMSVTPTSDYLLNVQFVDNQYWVVSIDDNDGIGGYSYVLVNAYTGEVQPDIKTEE